MQNIELYQVAIYLRLSKEDGDFSLSTGKTESDSISNQRELVLDYLKKRPELEPVEEFCDDGYSGTDFQRPAFTRMMDAIKARRINCVIVKDLSRFGREYIESGRYTEKIFPQLGIRFIAINDGYDSAADNNQMGNLVLPIKNLMNDSYSRDTSIKVRTHLEIKRKQGSLVSNFAVYGYQKDSTNKNKLCIDDYAAGVVRDIYKWKIQGLSPVSIAGKLNELGVASPMEYKRQGGSRYTSSFRTGSVAQWSHVAVRRILTNEVYTGVLIQGKRTTPNYKIKKSITKAAQDWCRVEGTHEAIITTSEFHLVQQLLKEDTRSGAEGQAIYPYAGRIFCGECNHPAVRKSVSSGGKKYAYYVCGQNKADKKLCGKHSIREDILHQAVLATVQAHIKLILDMDQALQEIESLAWERRELKKIQANILVQRELVEKSQGLRMGIYEDLKDGIITKDDFLTLKDEFVQRIQEAEKTILQYELDLNNIQEGFHEKQGFLAQFRQYHNISEITRTVVVNLIERVLIFKDKEIQVVFKQGNQIADMLQFLEESRSAKEAV